MKKRVLSFLLALSLMFSLAAVTGVTANAATIDSVAPTTGDGTADNPYQIGTAGELYWFAEKVNGGETAICAVLTADIVVNEGGVLDENGDLKDGDFANWPMIGYNTGYTGTFDGAGHNVTGVYLDGGYTQGVGLFGNIGSGGKVCNLGVTDSYFKGNSYWTGAVCGYNCEGTIENCYADATVVGYTSGGGVCGQNSSSSTITNCYSVGKVSGNSNVGGVCGYNYGKVTNCYNAGAVSGSSAVGGVCGYLSNGEVTNCYYDSTVYSGDAIGTNEGTAVGVSGKSTAQFASGEVAYLLNGSTSKGELAWGQKIGTDDYPVFNDGTNTVYVTKGCVSYNNDSNEVEKAHTCDENGVCSACGTYVISTAEQLFSFAAAATGSNTDINAVLANDITVNEAVFDENGELKESLTAWTPIGNAYSPYRGTFDGQNHTVSGLYFNDSSAELVGLFGYVGENGTVRNVGVVDSYFNGDKYVGGVCGRNGSGGTITNCYADVTVNGSQSIGGVCGHSFGIIANCYSTSKVSGTTNYGGVCGFLINGTIINCYYDKTKFTGNAVGYKTDDYTVTNVNGITPAQLESGEVAYKLSQGCKVDKTTYDGSIWGQEIGKDKSPVLGGKKVSATTGCVSYNNDGDDGEKAHDFVDGICTECGSYKISNAAELASFAAAVNGGNNEINAVLTADITVNKSVLKSDGNVSSGEFETWTPIGNYDNPYNGTFDGQNHTISGLYFNASNVSNIGLFGDVGENGVVTNVGVTDCYFNGYNGVGGLCAGNDGTVTNCFVRGTVYGGTGVGGVCGCNYGVIANCYAVATVNSGYYHGDLCGYNDGTITNCCFFGGYAGDNNNGTSVNVFSKTIAQFKSGEVTYLLNQNDENADGVWGQTIGTDDYPVLGGAKVYATTGCVTYTNNAELNGTEKEHGEFVNGICPDCGEYKPAEIIDGVYQLGTVTDLYWFAQAVNRGNNTINAVLTADITVNEDVFTADGNLNSGEFVAWTPIGYYKSESDNSAYNGRFDGKGHTVSGLYVNDSSAEGVGLFGYVGEKGVVINVGVVDSYFNGGYAVGGVCGYNNGQIGLCYFTGTVSGNDAVGGVCGGNSRLILSCYSTGVVNGENNVGGVCGSNNGQIGFCYYDSTVYGGSAIGSNNGDVQSVLGKTTAQFASGEVAYMLNFDPRAPYWGQTIGTDKYPVYRNDNNTVYATTGCVTFSNDASISGTSKEHAEFVNGMCPVCGVHEAANQNAETGVYEISNVGQLYWFADQVNSGNNAINAVLTADITVNENVLKADGKLNGSGFMAWTPIGNDDNRYNGTFDGQNHTISGLYFNDSSAKYIGLIGYIGTDGAVCNVGVLDSYFVGNDYVGGVCGRNKGGTIANCYYIGAADGSDHFGGVCGRSSGTVNNCYYDSTVCGDAIGYDSGESENVLGKTTAQFARGEVAYLLNQNDENENDVWGQIIGTDKYPTAHNDNNTVYLTTGCVTYTNNAELIGKEKEHGEFVNGMCPDCGECEAAVQNAETGVYEISNAGQLYWFADQVNGGNNTINAVLKNDITVNENVLKADGTLSSNEFMIWTPIGNYDNQYNGKFDGAEHNISGLYFNDANAYGVGLFGIVGENGVVSNVGVVDSYINADEYIGGICGENYGKVINCYNSGTINGTWDIGGLCGYSEGEFTNCYNTGMLSGKDCVGGLCGYSDGIITNCYNTGMLSGEDYVGGICGENYGIITNCYNTGMLSGKGDVGGICGDNYSEVTNCYYDSTVYGGSAFGYNSGTVGNVLGKTTAQFASGEVAYLLQSTQKADENENIPQVWGQTIGKDKAPVLGGAKVYQVEAYAGCINNPGDAGIGYSNTDAPVYAEHDMTHFEAKNPTCTANGNKEYWICSYEDGVYYKNKAGTEKYASYDEIKIRATGHTEEIIHGKAATCTEDGLTDGKKCSVCGEILVKQQIISKKGHTEEIIHGKAATCTEDGLTDGKKCSVCGEILVKQQVIAAKGHTYIFVDEVPATYDNDGVKAHYECSVCGKLFDLDKNEVSADELVIPKLEKTVTYGDLNRDGKVNLLDLIAMRKYLAKWNIEIDTEAADCNADGKVSLLDLILLRKYLAKWNVVLGPQA